MPDIKRRGLSRTPACCYMVVGVYGELCSSAGCRLPLDVVDRIIYVHSDIDTRLRVRAPPHGAPRGRGAAGRSKAVHLSRELALGWDAGDPMRIKKSKGWSAVVRSPQYRDDASPRPLRLRGHLPPRERGARYNVSALSDVPHGVGRSVARRFWCWSAQLRRPSGAWRVGAALRAVFSLLRRPKINALERNILDIPYLVHCDAAFGANGCGLPVR